MHSLPKVGHQTGRLSEPGPNGFFHNHPYLLGDRAFQAVPIDDSNPLGLAIR